jgi:DNA-binding NarL/FixJ family response regulator
MTEHPVADDRFDVWIVEDKRMLRRALASVIGEARDMRCSIAVETCEEALEAIEDGMAPDIVLMDIGLPGMNGIDGTRAIRSRSPTTRVIMLTVHEENEKIFEAICAGASGYLLKPSSTEQIVEAVRQVQRGAAPINAHIAKKMLTMFARLATPKSAADEYGLTAREREILQLLVEGMTIAQIAERLIVSYHTVDTHIRNIYGKLHVHSRGGAVAKAVHERLV